MHPENSPSRIQFYKELFKYYYYIQRAKRPSFQKRNSTHRRQGDLLEIHLCVLQVLTKAFQAFQPQDLPKAFQTFQSFQTFQIFQSFQSLETFQSFQTFQSFRTFQSFMTFQPFQAILQVPVPPGNPPHSSILRLECILYIFYEFYSSIGFHRNSTEYQLGNTNILQTFILQRKGDVVISVKIRID